MEKLYISVVEARNPDFQGASLTMNMATRSHPRLSPLNGKPILLGVDGADMSSDAGLTLLREIERKAGLAGRLAACMADPRDPAKVQHSLDDIIREKRAKVGDALRVGISWRCSDAVDSLPRNGYATCQRLPSPSCPIHRVIHPTRRFNPR